MTKSPIALAIEALEPFQLPVKDTYPDDQLVVEFVGSNGNITRTLTCGDFRNARTALVELKAASLMSPTDDFVVRKVAAAIGGTEAKYGGSVGGRLWDVDLINSARAAISAYVAAMGGE